MREPVVPQFDAKTYLLWRVVSASATSYTTVSSSRLRAERSTTIACRSMYESRSTDSFLRRVDHSDPTLRFALRRPAFFYPDAGVVREELSGTASVIEHPRVVVEVLSPSTPSYDLIEKRVAYRELASLEAYLIVHTTTRQLELDVRDADARFRTIASDDRGVPLGNGTMTLDEVYSRTSHDRA